jgi:chromosomal replication initiation ATPase DnaA
MPPRRPFTFETFVATDGARPALDACLSAASRATDVPRSLVLVGPSGCGKTHLLCAIAARVSAAAGTESGVVYTTANDLRAKLVLALRAGQATDGLLGKPSTRLTVVDDLQTLAEHPATQDMIARAWSSAVEGGITVVGACSGTAAPLAPLRDALSVEGTAWIEMPRPTRADAMRIVDTLVRAHHLTPDDTEARKVLASWNGDVRRLLGATTHRAFAARHGQPATPPPWVRSA